MKLVPYGLSSHTRWSGNCSWKTDGVSSEKKADRDRFSSFEVLVFKHGDLFFFNIIDYLVVVYSFELAEVFDSMDHHGRSHVLARTG